MELFGFTLGKKKPLASAVKAVVSPPADDGATMFGSDGAAYYSQVLDLEATIKNENDLIRRYREAAAYPDCDSAIEDIINEAISAEDGQKSVDIDLDDLKLSDSIKKKIHAEFDEIVRLMKFEENGHEIFRNWYIDGRLYYHILLDPSKPKDGIIDIIKIDPRKIRYVKDVKKKKSPTGVDMVVSVDEYYLYNDKGLSEKTTQGVKLSKDSVIYVPSGIVDGATGTVISYLHKAVKTVNQLKMIEDSLVIYRLSRAPERRIFYIDVGNLPKLKAEQYVTDIMNKYRNKIVYDASTGEVRDDRKHMSMMEDFWMPRREGGKGTEITTLAGGQNLQNLEDVEHFQNKLYSSLNVPLGRLVPSTGFSMGKSSEISRDEIKFSKFVSRLRKKFSKLFIEALRVQLIAKGIMSQDDWEDNKQFFQFDFIRDNHFAELKEAEILQARLATLQLIEPYIGRFYDVTFVKKNVLMQTDEEIELMTKGMENDSKKEDPALSPSPLEQSQMSMQMGMDQEMAQHQQGIDQENAEHGSALKKDEIKANNASKPKPKSTK
jgi:hypothetical protein